MAGPVVLLSIPQLRHRDVAPGGLASLEALAGRGDIAELIPAFPGLAAPAFATLMTGEPPARHGMVGDAYFDRATRAVVHRPFPDSAVTAPKLWEVLRAARPGAETLLWFAPNSRGAAVGRSAWADEDCRLATDPPGLAAELEATCGAYPCPAGTGEPPRLGATAWMLRSAAAAIAAAPPDLAIVRIPYLGQVARRYGPDGREANRSVRELDAALGPFLAALPAAATVLAVTESVSTPVSGPVSPNRVLRDLDLLRLVAAPGGGTQIDPDASAAFALVDHQLCHIYLNDPARAAEIAAVFSGEDSDGVATVACGARRARLGLDHPRAGDVVLVATPDRWFTPDWWDSPSEVPRGPGGPGLIPIRPGLDLDPTRVRGSLGAPPPDPDYYGVLVSSSASLIPATSPVPARDVPALVRRALGLG